VAHLKTFDRFGDGLIIGAGRRLVGREVAADQQALSQQIVVGTGNPPR
jgi:hypothetical protein